LEPFLFEQKISYAKSKSNFVSKLDGTFKMPTATGAAAVEQTELQQSIFNAPPAGSNAASSGLPVKPSPAVDSVMKDADTPESRGQKRTRVEESEDSDEDVAMEEDSDDE
jgi:U2 small nuclear ribonucleoprotein B''